jgi:hypothetical protein
MSMWDHEDVNRQIVEGLRKIARRIEEVEGIVPLKPGELRPPGYYMADRYTSIGGKPLWPSERKKKRRK